MLDWNDIRLFLAVAQEGTTLGAARQLRVSQSTVARRIAALEQALGAELFDKRQTGYALTEAGRDALDAARAVEGSVGEFAAAIAAHRRGNMGAVRLTTNELIADLLLVKACAEFRALHPDIEIELITADRRFDLSKGEADVALRAGPPPSEPALVGRRLAADVWSVYCTRDYGAKHGIPRNAEDLAGHDFFGMDRNFPRTDVTDWVDRVVPANRVLIRHSSLARLLAGLKSGLGVTMMADFLAEADPALVRCFTPDLPFPNEIWLLTHERLRRTPRICALMDFLGDYFGKGRHRVA